MKKDRCERVKCDCFPDCERRGMVNVKGQILDLTQSCC